MCREQALGDCTFSDKRGGGLSPHVLLAIRSHDAGKSRATIFFSFAIREKMSFGWRRNLVGKAHGFRMILELCGHNMWHLPLPGTERMQRPPQVRKWAFIKAMRESNLIDALTKSTSAYPMKCISSLRDAANEIKTNQGNGRFKTTSSTEGPGRNHSKVEQDCAPERLYPHSTA